MLYYIIFKVYSYIVFSLGVFLMTGHEDLVLEPSVCIIYD